MRIVAVGWWPWGEQWSCGLGVRSMCCDVDVLAGCLPHRSIDDLLARMRRAGAPCRRQVRSHPGYPIVAGLALGRPGRGD